MLVLLNFVPGMLVVVRTVFPAMLMAVPARAARMFVRVLVLVRMTVAVCVRVRMGMHSHAWMLMRMLVLVGVLVLMLVGMLVVALHG
ncbi:MAG: hypothetical protein AB9900_07305 [Humidesulfovibrio sp.]